MKKRGIRVAIWCMTLILGGLLYGKLVDITGLAIPCMFHLVTGMKCPGCGVTRMCLHILKGDFYEAFMENPVVFTLLPFLFYFMVKLAYNYIFRNTMQLHKIENMILTVIAVACVIYAILRNIPILNIP